MIKKLALLGLLCCPLSGFAFDIDNRTADPLDVELVTTDHVWGWHQFTIPPYTPYTEPFVEQPDKPTYYRMCIRHNTGIFSKRQRTLSGILHSEKVIAVTFENDQYVFTVDGEKVIKGKLK